MTLTEARNYVRFNKIFALDENFYRDLKKYRGCEIIVQKPPSGDENDYVPLIGVVRDKKLVAMYVDEDLVTPARIDLFFDDNKIKRPHK